ncbi:hypothetical protein BDV95DRAFT_586047 [Massariosphaeria phaeospora]|uniref:RNA binding protein Nrd1 n=1 Tax=Massariosphaeria phaeospora TaxID=100035 RepID=A0A7C8HYX9_9PLEO|nr:hypothetical protein BDV95DRAFT_586047 [Massariosphaeria phaeospora]
MMAAMEELETHLQSLLALKPPGVTKTKIETITKQCVENVQSDAVIVQKIVQQFVKSPDTHKLGVLYVIDSVVRQWMEKARVAGQAVSKNAAPGTFASGAQKIADALPGLMTASIQSAPENQKEKISKLVDIWERAQTFPVPMLTGFKQQLSKPQDKSFTPPGDPPKSQAASNAFGRPANSQPIAPPAPTVVPQDAGALLAALANLGQQNAQTNIMPPAPPASVFPQNIAAPPPPPGFLPPPSVAPTNGQGPLPVLPAQMGDLANQIMVAITNRTIPPEQGIMILQALAAQSGGNNMPLLPQQPPVPQPQPVQQNGTQHDRYEQMGNRYRERSRSPVYRARSRSPIRRSPPNRRDSPTYGVYDPSAVSEGNAANRQERGERGRNRGRNRGARNDRNEYRQRSPPSQRRLSSPTGSLSRNGQGKFMEWDSTLPRDSIRVLSRTLFVGGASGTESEIRNIFSRFGKVQTCIVNQDKRHAFVKMVNRRDAISAKEGMDNLADPSALSKARQTRWGVGFGPRDCSDYASGVSVIPISRLTDADRKWVSTAEYGGTGGRALEGGMVIEEPDIEIGAGVSSKAISRRVPPEAAGRGRGSNNSNSRGAYEGGARFRKQDRSQVHEPRRISPRPEPVVAVPPAVPGFGFQLPGF